MKSSICTGRRFFYLVGAAGALVAFGGTADGAPPSLTYTQGGDAVAISADGSTVLGQSARIWTGTGQQVSLDTEQCIATGISANGRYVSGYRGSSAGGGFGDPPKACRWDRQGSRLDLGLLPGETTSKSMGISADGMTIFGNGDSTHNYIFKWTPATGILPIAPPDSGNPTVAAVSAFGTSFVAYLYNSTAFRWKSDFYTVIGGGRPYAVSSNGNIVVGNLGGPAYWTLPTGVVSLGVSGYAYCMSEDGAVIGGDSWIWTNVYGVVDLQAYLRARGVSLPGNSYFREIRGLSSDGTVIAANGYVAGFGDATFKITIPDIRRPYVNGRVSLEDLSIDAVRPTSCQYQVSPAGGGAPIATGTALLNASGDFAVDMPAAKGQYLLTVKVSHWLAQTVAVDTTAGKDTGKTWSLVNGDVDGDDLVGLFDYLLLSEAFDSNPVSGNWLANADLDGDETVSVFDYLILSANFDRVGSWWQ